MNPHTQSMDSKKDSRPDRPVVAMVYDVDGTLIAGNMQEYGYLPWFNVEAEEFWQKTNEQAQEQDASNIDTYMLKLLQMAKEENKAVTRQMLRESGEGIMLFPGVNAWFDLVDEEAQGLDISVEHYIISSGLEEMISGLPIYERFTKVFASGYCYDDDGNAIWPRVAIDYTGKTQFLFKINKGIYSVADSEMVNKNIPESERRIPFQRMIYFGDGATDVPAMRLVKAQGGYSIAVYDPAKVLSAQRLLMDNRVHFCHEADYTAGKPLHTTVCTILKAMRAQLDLEQLIQANRAEMNMREK